MDDKKQYLQSGIYAATLTPLNADLSCNSELLVSHCRNLIERGCKGVVLFGTTGEGPSFSLNERKEILAQAIAYGLDPHQIIVGNGSSGVCDTIDLIHTASQLGSMTFLIAPPSFYKGILEEGVVSFYREILRDVQDLHLRVILYHIPQFSGVPISLKIIEKLVNEFPETVVGIKESEGKLSFTKEILEAFPGFKVYVGNESQIPQAVQYGAAGAICGMPNLYPEWICSLYERGEYVHEIEGFLQVLKGYSFISAFKAVMEKRQGNAWHWVRPPLVPLDPVESNRFLSLLGELKLY